MCALNAGGASAFHGAQIYLDQFLQDMRKDASMDSILDDIAQGMMEAQETYTDLHLPNMLDYEFAKPNLMMRLCDPETSLDFLADKPWTPCGELATTYRVKIPGFVEGQICSTVVTNQMMEAWGVSVEQLHADAVQAENETNPIRILELANEKFRFIQLKETTFSEPPAQDAGFCKIHQK